MADELIKNPILNSPYEEPAQHFRFTDDGITNQIVDTRRISSYFVPSPQPKKKGKLECGCFVRPGKKGQVAVRCKSLASTRVSSHDSNSRGSGSGLCWRATRRGIPGRGLIETMGAGCGLSAASRLAPRPIGSIDPPLPGKLRRRQAAVSPVANASSNSTGGTYPNAECSRLRL